MTQDGRELASEPKGDEMLFRFSGTDALSRLMVVVLVVGGGAGPVVLKLFDIAFHVGLLKTILYVGGIGAVIFFGLRNTIVVTEQRVTIVKHWFFIPYWRWTAREIESVWFGGDWGEADGAIGVVVQLGQREIHIGSPKTMHELHAALEPFAVRWQGGKRKERTAGTQRDRGPG